MRYAAPMETLIPAFLRRQRNQRRLTLENLSAKVGMSPQHLSEIESGKRDPRLSSIERMAEAMGMTVLIVREEKRQQEVGGDHQVGVRRHPARSSPSGIPASRHLG